MILAGSYAIIVNDLERSCYEADRVMTVTRRMIGGGVLLYCGTVAATYAYTLNSKDVQANAGLGTSVEGRRKLWEENARSYDRYQ